MRLTEFGIRQLAIFTILLLTTLAAPKVYGVEPTHLQDHDILSNSLESSSTNQPKVNETALRGVPQANAKTEEQNVQNNSDVTLKQPAETRQSLPRIETKDPSTNSSVGCGNIVSVEKATNDIVKLQIQLMKISTKFHLTWFTPPKGKSWRVFGYRIAGSTLTNVGMSCIAASRFEYRNHPGDAPRPFLRSGHILNLIASSIIVGGTLTEATIDRIHDRRLAKQGLSPQSSLENFKSILSQLDALIEQRRALAVSCAELTSEQKAIIEADGLVLKDIRDLTCAEFAHSYCDVVRLRAQRDIGNVEALIGASTAGYLGSLNALLAVADRNNKQIGVAGIGFITSGSSVVTAPMLTKLCGDLAVKRAEKKLQGILLDDNEATRARFEQNRAKLESLIASANSNDTNLLQALDAREAVYALKDKMFNSRHEFRVNHRRKAKRELVERQIYASIIGGANIARGAQLAVAGFHYTNQPKTIYRIVASSATCYIAGSGVWTFDNIQGKVREEIAKANMKKAKLSVQGRLNDDLDALEEMEDQMSIY